MKILITQADSWLNKGDAAIVISMTKALKEKFSDATITISTIFPPQEIDIISYGKYGIKVVPPIFQTVLSLMSKFKSIKKFRIILIAMLLLSFLFSISRYTLWLLLYNKLKMDIEFLIRDIKDVIQEYKSADLILSCGGEHIVHEGGLPFGLLRALYEIAFGIYLGKPVMLYAQSIGPFKGRYCKPLVRWVLNRVDLITLRERISKTYLDDLGIATPTFVTADAAFTLPPISQEEAEKLIEHNIGSLGDKVLVGITVRYWNSPNFDRYLEIIAHVADYMITELNAYVIFFCHNTNPLDDDRPVTEEVFSKIKQKQRVKILEGYSPEQLKGMYGCMDIFIGTRMHSCILALSMVIPTIVIGYRHKAQGIMKMLGLDFYVCDINTLTLDELKYKVDKLWLEREKIKKILKERIREIQTRSMENLNLITNIVERGEGYEQSNK